MSLGMSCAAAVHTNAFSKNSSRQSFPRGFSTCGRLSLISIRCGTILRPFTRSLNIVVPFRMHEMSLNETVAADVPVDASKRVLPLLMIMFVGSGCSALIYEIVWFQLLELVIGSSTVSLGILL